MITYRSHVPAVLAQLERGIQNAVARSAIIMQTEIKLQLNKGASPPASAPGQPPHKRTGRLGQSIQVDLSKLRSKNPTARIGPNIAQVPYARVHEYGSRGPIKPKRGKFLVFTNDKGEKVFARSVTLPARPYIRPAVKLARPKIRAQFNPKRLLSGR